MNRFPFTKLTVEIRANCTMRRLAVLSLLLALASPVLADEASNLYNKGRDVEARLDYEAAFTYYNQAYQLKPKNLAYQTASIRVRALAASQHVHRGQQLRSAGHLEEAILEFRTAALTDPSSFIAQQEIRRTLVMMQSVKATGSEMNSETSESSAQKKLDNATGPVELSTLSTAPITLKMTEDAKVVYSTIGKLAGLNVVFDPDFKTQRISVELVKVTLEEAFQVVRMESRSFTRPVTSNTIYVAADTPAKRKEVEENVMETFYLSNLSQPSDLTDIATTIRSTLDLTRITPMPSQGALIVRGTPDQLTLVRKLIQDMDKARPEVSVEVMVMQVTRDRIRQLGIQPPTSATVSFLGTNGASAGNGSSSVSLSDLSKLTATDFAVTIPQVTANALFSDSQSKLIQNPQIRALDGQRASLRIGQRYPIATGSFSSGLGGAGISPLVNTQFQYIDVGVNIDITPRVHGDNDVTLKLVLDITAVDSVTSIGGITQPIIGQRKIEHEIRLKDGEINLLGGMLEEADAKTLSGLPWLSSIPLLRYFFSSEQTDKRQNELVFVLIPHIVRVQELDKKNHQQLDIGTSNAIELRRLASGTPREDSPKSDPAPLPISTLDRSAPKLPIAGTETGTDLADRGVPMSDKPAITAGSLSRSESKARPPTANPLSMTLTTPLQSAVVGKTFTLNRLLGGAEDPLSRPTDLQYDTSFLEFASVTQGTRPLKRHEVLLRSNDDLAKGIVQIIPSTRSNDQGVPDKGPPVRVSFTAKKPGVSTIQPRKAHLSDIGPNPLPVEAQSLSMDVRSKT